MSETVRRREMGGREEGRKEGGCLVVKKCTCMNFV